MKMNFNNWFYEFHNYYQPDDSSWVDIGKRYQRLQEIHSSLMHKQPYGIVGNQYGFDRFMDLLSKSSYSIQDVNEAMIETYEKSLRRAMGSMLVNTHAVIFHSDTLTDSHVHNEPLTTNYVVDIPYDQMHFGERDEFIRQQIHRMHNSTNREFVHIKEFNEKGYSKLLDFACICSINGKICNEFYIGFDDHGFRFKFIYNGSNDSELIIYKIDTSAVFVRSIPRNNLKPTSNGVYQIPINTGQYDTLNMNGLPCIVSIYPTEYQENIQCVPNFGYMNGRVLTIPRIQPGTFSMLQQCEYGDLTVIVFVTKFLHEINGIFPSLNYMNFTHTHPIYTDQYNPVATYENHPVIGSNQQMDQMYHIPICTPPICIDRDYDIHFDVLCDCVNMKTYLSGESCMSIIRKVSNALVTGIFKEHETLGNHLQAFINQIYIPLSQLRNYMTPYYQSYQKGALLTSLVSSELVSLFTTFLHDIDRLGSVTEETVWRDYINEAFYTDAYVSLIDELCQPFEDCETLQIFKGVSSKEFNFLPKESPYRFHRPVAEQCFIALQYDRDEQSYVFAYPNIKHFKGIENSFYIRDELDGSELFKFFVLYTDTNAPTAEEGYQDCFNEELVLDYDAFITEIQPYIGFIRYWDVENQLMKLSKILYGEYNDQTVSQVISDLLQHRIDTKDLVDTYWSDIKYDQSNITSHHWQDYTDMSEGAPFYLNYLFYTLSVLNDGDDSMQASFYRHLTDRKFNLRYLDYNVSKAFDDQPKIICNFAKITQSMTIDTNGSNPINDSHPHLYAGFPGIVTDTTKDNDNYEYTFTNGIQQFPLIQQYNVDTSHYLKNNTCTTLDLYPEIQFAKLCTKYLTCVREFISHIETNYKTPIDQTFAIESYRDSLRKIHQSIVQLFEDENEFHVIDSNTSWVHDILYGNDPFLKDQGFFDQLEETASKILRNTNFLFGAAEPWDSKNTSKASMSKDDRYFLLYQSANWMCRMLRYLYYVHGFHHISTQRIRGLYLYFKKFFRLNNIHQLKLLHMHLDETFLVSKFPTKKMGMISASIVTGIPLIASHIKNIRSLLDHNTEKFVEGLHDNLGNAIVEYEEVLTDLHDMNSTLLHTMEEYVNLIMDHYVFDMYVIDHVGVYVPSVTLVDTVEESYTTLSEKPAYAVMEIQTDDPHFKLPFDDTVVTKKLYFSVMSQYDANASKYRINVLHGLRPCCEYICFNGEAIIRPVIAFYREDGTMIPHTDAPELLISFRRIGNSADRISDMGILCNHYDTNIDLQNVHENINREEDNMIITRKCNTTNYEMLFANRYMHLYHTYEMIYNKTTVLPGPIDRVNIPNTEINRFLFSEIGSKPTSQLFFKPVQIEHPQTYQADIADNYEAIGYGYTVGQKIYVMTKDALHYIFPAIVTSVDKHYRWNLNGMIEAKVDARNAKWFEIKDPILRETYLTGKVECTILNDNFCNFLDEFTDSDEPFYHFMPYPDDLEFYDEDFPEMVSVPGDPIAVVNHADYMYHRIQSLFPSLIENPFGEEIHKTWKFEYLGFHSVDEDSPYTTLGFNVFNKNRSPLTDVDLYPILRQEPNDHLTHELEKKVYQEKLEEIEPFIERNSSRIEELSWILKHETLTDDQRRYYEDIIRQCQWDLKKYEGEYDRIKTYIDEPEHATTWFNVDSYEAAQVYLTNNRTKRKMTYQPDIRDLLYSDKVKILLYDWDQKQWLDPDTYEIHAERSVDKVTPMDYHAYDSTDIDNMHYLRMTISHISIQCKQGHMFQKSSRILAYLVFDKNDMYDFSGAGALDHDCHVWFKPILSTCPPRIDDATDIVDPYTQLTIRKHVDLYEKYHLTEWESLISDDKYYNEEPAWENVYQESYPFEEPINGLKLIKITRNVHNHNFNLGTSDEAHQIKYSVDRSHIHSGDIPYTPIARFCHLYINLTENNETEVHPFYEDNTIHVYVKNPFPNTKMNMFTTHLEYQASIIQPIDQFREDERIKLICINDQQSDYDGNISSIMFMATTSVDSETGEQVLTVLQSNLSGNMQNSSFTCSVLHDVNYASEGGLIKIDCTKVEDDIWENGYAKQSIDGKWILLPKQYLQYIEIPDEFLITIQANDTAQIDVIIDTSYEKKADDVILKDNSNPFNPFEFYYNYIYKIRYPISNIRHNQYDVRLVKDYDAVQHDDIRKYMQIVKTNTIHVCRYCCYNIPKNGFFDVTSYIPTPLSRTRYEFWVNGRQLLGNEHLIILSPTSFQLIGLTSLKNFELIELVDDYGDTPLTQKGPIYIDLHGNVYTDYRQAFLSNHEMIQQDLRYTFQGFPNHTPIQDVTNGFIGNPNNVDVEENIMKYWENGIHSEDDYHDAYDEYYNIPTLNGVQLYHPNMEDLGLREIPNYEIIPYFDKAWKKEILTNPLFPMTHFDESMTYDNQYVLFHISKNENGYMIYTTGNYARYFTIYLSDNEYASIESLQHTKQIIPMVHCGTRIQLDASMVGLWIHATVVTYVPKKIN